LIYRKHLANLAPQAALGSQGCFDIPMPYAHPSLIRRLVMLAKHCAAVAFTALIWSAAAGAGVVDADYPAISYVSFKSPNLSPSQPLSVCYPEAGDPEVVGQLTMTGQLRLPGAMSPGDKVPAVVILHGSAGIDSRGSLYAESLNQAGIATLEVDMWSPRGLSGGANRPAFPTLNTPDAFGALNYLGSRDDIDLDRIGLLGFSWGGVVTMLAATTPYTDCYGRGRSFAAHVANYPVCWAYNANLGLPFPGLDFEDLTGKPVLIQIGTKDDYDDGPESCNNLASPFPNVSVNVYNNAYHAWDRLQPAVTVVDPFSHHGAGGEVEIVPNPGKAFQSRAKVVDFFKMRLHVE
jgi:uncharacterized protein